MNFIDFFSGAGGMRMGLERAGHKCIGFCEFDKYARQSYKAEFNTEGEWESHDIRTVKPGDMPRAELWTYGFPCQGISISGKIKGVGRKAEDPEADERSNLFFQIIRLLAGVSEEDRPEWLLCENVKNLLSVDRGYALARILYNLEEMGYDSEWQLFNTKHSYVVGGEVIEGIPQNRERVYIVSHLRRKGGRKVFPIERADREDTVKLHKIAGRWGMEHQIGSVYDKEGLSPALDTCGDGGREPLVLEQDNKIKRLGSYRPSGHKATSVVDPTGIAPAVMENYGQVTATVVKAILTPDRLEKRQNGRRMKEDGEPMFTLTVQDRHGVVVMSETDTDNNSSTGL